MSGVNEDLLRNLMAGDVSKNKTETDSQQENIKGKPKKRNDVIDYSHFLQTSDKIEVRQSVYIPKDIHSVIENIVTHIGDNNLTIGKYVSNVLTEHLKLYKDDINKLYIENKPSKLIIE